MAEDDKKKTKKELEEEVEDLTNKLNQISIGYQNLLTANQGLQGLVIKYEETINLMSARLLESRQTQG
tara:strand:- start:6113 stop:6316 length:204 start_codon:yes stop_codon:yes gene_type:complete